MFSPVCAHSIIITIDGSIERAHSLKDGGKTKV